MKGLVIALGALLGVPAHAAETVTLIRPTSPAGPGEAAAVRIGTSVAAKLDRDPDYRRLGDEPLVADEILTAFECRQLDAACAQRVGDAAGADLAIYGAVEPAGDGLHVALHLIEVRGGRTRRSVARRMPARGHRAIGALTEELLTGIAPAAFAIETQPVPPPDDAAGSHWLGWGMVALASAAAVGAGWAAYELRQTQRDFDAADDGDALRRYGDRGQTLEMTTNTLLVTSGVSFGIAAWLLLDEN